MSLIIDKNGATKIITSPKLIDLDIKIDAARREQVRVRRKLHKEVVR